MHTHSWVNIYERDDPAALLVCVVVVTRVAWLCWQDGMSWLLASPEESLPFILADRGFDVWIANNRGTRWSRRHVSLDPSSRVINDDELRRVRRPSTYCLLIKMLIDFDPLCSSQLYWNWSWDDLVVNDLPAMVDFVCGQTGQKPHYVGHSMVRTAPTIR